MAAGKPIANLAERKVRRARAAGVGIDVVGGVLLVSGPRAVADVWRPLLQQHRRAIVALLAPQEPGPQQLEFGGRK